MHLVPVFGTCPARLRKRRSATYRPCSGHKEGERLDVRPRPSAGPRPEAPPGPPTCLRPRPTRARFSTRPAYPSQARPHRPRRLPPRTTPPPPRGPAPPLLETPPSCPRQRPRRHRPVPRGPAPPSTRPAHLSDAPPSARLAGGTQAPTPFGCGAPLEAGSGNPDPMGPTRGRQRGLRFRVQSEVGTNAYRESNPRAHRVPSSYG